MKRPRGKCPSQRPTSAQSSGRMPNASRSVAAHASTTSVAPAPITSARTAKSAAASITAIPSEEHAHAGAHATARQRRDILEERGVHARLLVEQVAAVEEDLPGVTS